MQVSVATRSKGPGLAFLPYELCLRRASSHRRSCTVHSSVDFVFFYGQLLGAADPLTYCILLEREKNTANVKVTLIMSLPLLGAGAKTPCNGTV